MDKMPAFYIFFGLLMGASIGFVVGAAAENAIRGMQLGASAGLFIGWFIAATVLAQGRRQ